MGFLVNNDQFGKESNASSQISISFHFCGFAPSAFVIAMWDLVEGAISSFVLNCETTKKLNHPRIDSRSD